MIPIYQPYLTKNNLKHAHKALDSGWISSQGEYLDLTKNLLKSKAKYNNHKIVLTNNGTTATHLLALALQYKYPSIKKIIVPNNVYVAAWNAFLYTQKYELIPVDANLYTWNFEDSYLEELLDEETAVLIVHNIGNIINVPKLKQKFPNTIFVEDNCEGFLGSYGDKPSGSECFASSISFFGNKTITCGEGGAFITSDDELFSYINTVKNQGQSHKKFIHDYLGYNYRMTNIQAAILYGQLNDLDWIINQKKNIFNQYRSILKLPNISFQHIDPDTSHSNWMLGMRFLDFDLEKKKSLELYLYEAGIDTRPMFYDIHQHKYLKPIKCVSNENSKILQNQCLMVPSYPTLSESQISFICDKIIHFLKYN
jgi:perosamine synthetase